MLQVMWAYLDSVSGECLQLLLLLDGVLCLGRRTCKAVVDIDVAVLGIYKVVAEIGVVALGGITVVLGIKDTCPICCTTFS